MCTDLGTMRRLLDENGRRELNAKATYDRELRNRDLRIAELEAEIRQLKSEE